MLGSSTPRLFNSITRVSGILDHPHSRVTTTEYEAAISRHELPEVCILFARPLQSESAGKTGCLLHPRSRVPLRIARDAHEHTGTAGASRPSLRNGLTAYAVISPEPNSSGLRRCRISGSSKPGWASQTSVSLAPATGVRTTRFCRTQRAPSSCAPSAAHEFDLALQPPCAPTRFASIASHRAFVTMANAPHLAVRRAELCD